MTSISSNGAGAARDPSRRHVVAGGLAAATLLALPVNAATEKAMHGLIGRMIAKEGERDSLIAILLEGVNDMPGCLSYIVAKDVKDSNAIWVTEVWDSKDSHAASLKLPVVQAAIAKGRPLIAGFDSYSETMPAGGFGLPRATP